MSVVLCVLHLSGNGGDITCVIQDVEDPVGGRGERIVNHWVMVCCWDT